MVAIFLFIIGLAVGSFLNVLIIRYSPEKGLFHHTSVGGRSRCTKCLTQLRWYELIPLASFFVLCGKCRTCKVGISFQYPIVELLTGGIFILPLHSWPLTIALTILLLITVIDLRTSLIPDEATMGIAITGALYTWTLYAYDKFDFIKGSFLGEFGMLFGLRDGVITNHLVAGLVALLLFVIIVVATYGRCKACGRAWTAFGLARYYISACISVWNGCGGRGCDGNNEKRKYARRNTIWTVHVVGDATRYFIWG
jgi:prepilin signal peptidase PulO-like enzyme (type II secretory pathway)